MSNAYTFQASNSLHFKTLIKKKTKTKQLKKKAQVLLNHTAHAYLKPFPIKLSMDIIMQRLYDSKTSEFLKITTEVT